MPTSTDRGDRFRVHTILSLLTLAIGVILMVYMVTVEDEPGAVPLLLIVLGAGWYLFARSRIRKRRE